MEKRLIERYVENNKLRTLINLIPSVGGALDYLLSVKGNEFREERLSLMLENLDKRILDLESDLSLGSSVNKKIDTEEFYDLLIQSFNSVIKTRHKEKIKCYSNILFNFVQDKKSTISSDIMLSVLDTITIDEIHYLSALKKYNGKIKLYGFFNSKVFWEVYHEHIKKNGKIADSDKSLPQECVLNENIDLIWKLLNDKNLITQNISNEFGRLDYTYSTQWQSIRSSVDYSGVFEYELTQFGKEFIEWLIE